MEIRSKKPKFTSYSYWEGYASFGKRLHYRFFTDVNLHLVRIRPAGYKLISEEEYEDEETE